MKSIVISILFYIFIASRRHVDGGNCLKVSNDKYEELKMGDIVDVQSVNSLKEQIEDLKIGDVLVVGVQSPNITKENPEALKLGDILDIDVQPANKTSEELNINDILEVGVLPTDSLVETPVELKKGDIVGVQSANRSGLEYAVVSKNGRSPFGSQTILEHLKYSDFDYELYKSTIFECVGNLTPGRAIRNEEFDVGDIIGYMYEHKPGVSYRLLKDDDVRETLVCMLRKYTLDMFAIFKSTDEKYYEILEKYIGWNEKCVAPISSS